jgi:hypothetical protein
VRSGFCSSHGLADLSFPLSQIERVGARAGFPVIPLSRIMADSALVTGEFYHGFPNTEPGRGHWNERGHGLAARILHDWLQSGPGQISGRIGGE